MAKKDTFKVNKNRTEKLIKVTDRLVLSIYTTPTQVYFSKYKKADGFWMETLFSDTITDVLSNNLYLELHSPKMIKRLERFIK